MGLLSRLVPLLQEVLRCLCADAHEPLAKRSRFKLFVVSNSASLLNCAITDGTVKLEQGGAENSGLRNDVQKPSCPNGISPIASFYSGPAIASVYSNVKFELFIIQLKKVF